MTNAAQVIVAADVTDQANDMRQVQPMVARTVQNLEAAGVDDSIGAFTADAGYFSEGNNESTSTNTNGLMQRTLQRVG